MFKSQHRIGIALMAVSAVGLAAIALSTQSHSAETAQAGAAALKLEITTRCDRGAATFQVKNAGTAWPKTSTFAVYRLSPGGGHVIAKRRMRLSAGQKASFRIKASRNTTGRLGLNVNPSWYSRAKVLDAKVDCR